MQTLRQEVDRVARESRFSGAVRVDRRGRIELDSAYGLAHRGHAIANTTQTQFAVASGVKGFTALSVVTLIEQGSLDLSTTARSVLGPDLPLIRDDVTIEHLLSHRSGIGDYLDEELLDDPDDYVLPIPVHRLATTEQYLAVLDGHRTKFLPGERFAYNNSGYVVLALIAERTAGEPFHELVRERVFEPARMTHSTFHRSDELPGSAAVGYLGSERSSRTNVFHLPVRGNGDGGAYSTVADVSSFWRALFAGRIVSCDWVSEMVQPRSALPDESMRYGLGFWLAGSGDAVILEGSDAGVSFRTVHDPRREITHTVVSNTSDGAWPIARLLVERLGT